MAFCVAMWTYAFRVIYRFQVDETNPEETLAEALYEEESGYSYEILSKPTGPNRNKSR